MDPSIIQPHLTEESDRKIHNQPMERLAARHWETFKLVPYQELVKIPPSIKPRAAPQMVNKA